MHKYKVTTTKGEEIVFADGYDIFPPSYGRSRMARFYKGKYMSHEIWDVISVEEVK